MIITTRYQGPRGDHGTRIYSYGENANGDPVRSHIAYPYAVTSEHERHQESAVHHFRVTTGKPARVVWGAHLPSKNNHDYVFCVVEKDS